MENFINVLKTFVGEDNLSEEDIAKAKALPEKEQKELGTALNSLQPYWEDVPPELSDAVNAILKSALKESEAPKEKEITIDEFITKAGARFSKATIEKIKKAIAMLEGLVTEKEGNVKKDHKDLPADVVAKLEELERRKEDDIAAVKKADDDEKKDLLERVKKLEKGNKKKGEKTSIDDPGEKDEDEDADDDKGVKKKEDKQGDFKELSKQLFPGQE